MSIPKRPSREDFPDALSGGEGHDNVDHRIGETTRHGPKMDEIDPSRSEPKPAPRQPAPAPSGETRR